MTKKKEFADLNAVVTFYEPHPGFGGAGVPLSGPVKKAIDELNGKTMTLRQGIAKIKATGIRKLETRNLATLEIWEDPACIVLGLGEWPPKKAPHHTWMLIKYKLKPKEIIKTKKKDPASLKLRGAKDKK